MWSAFFCVTFYDKNLCPWICVSLFQLIPIRTLYRLHSVCYVRKTNQSFCFQVIFCCVDFIYSTHFFPLSLSLFFFFLSLTSALDWNNIFVFLQCRLFSGKFAKIWIGDAVDNDGLLQRILYLRGNGFSVLLHLAFLCFSSWFCHCEFCQKPMVNIGR